jgi:YgiT-type zinc finger domain-containing protein
VDPQDEAQRHVCSHCGAETHADVVKAAFWREGKLVAIEDIPARVCEGCGEQFYDEVTSRRIEKVVTGQALNPKRQILTPVFSLAEMGDD